MDKRPKVIGVSKTYAGAFFLVLVFISGYGFVYVVSDGEDTIIAKIGIALASIFGLFIACFGIFTLFSRRFDYDPDYEKHGKVEPYITITDEEIICEYPSQRKTEKLSWENLTKIQVLTTDQGPSLCDVFLMLTGADGKGVAIPTDKTESKLIIDKILKFPGFDHETFIAAMGSTAVKWFDVWELK